MPGNCDWGQLLAAPVGVLDPSPDPIRFGYPLTSKPPRLERGIPQKSWRNVPVSIDAAMAAEEDAAMAECVCV